MSCSAGLTVGFSNSSYFVSALLMIVCMLLLISLKVS